MEKPLGRWYINGNDIVKIWQLYPKRGTFDALLKRPQLKEYLTEDIREEHGESVDFYKPRFEARDVDLTFYLITEYREELWEKLERISIEFGQMGLIEFRLESHNRNFQLYYKGMDSNTRKTLSYDGHCVCEVRLSFREPNPRNVFFEDSLIAEDMQPIITEQKPDENTLIATLSRGDDYELTE